VCELIAVQINGFGTAWCDNSYAKRVYYAYSQFLDKLLLASSSTRKPSDTRNNHTLVMANCYVQRREIRIFLRTVLSLSPQDRDWFSSGAISRSTQNWLLLLTANGHFTIFCPRDRYPVQGSLNAETRSTSPLSHIGRL
jgi:hypothetical protein